MKLKSRRSIPPGAGGATTTATSPESTCTDTGPASTTGLVASGSAVFGATAFAAARLTELRRVGFLAAGIWSTGSDPTRRPRKPDHSTAPLEVRADPAEQGGVHAKLWD